MAAAFNCVRECRLLRFFRNKRQNCKSFCRVPPRNAFRNSPLAVVAKAPVTAACTTLTVIAEDINAETRKQLCRSVWCNTHEQRQLQAGRNFGQVCSKGKKLLKCSKIGKAGRNFGQPAQKPEYKCLNSEQTKKLAEISASPKKNENNYAYSPGNQKAGRNFGQKGQKLHIHIVVCNVTQNLAEISASFRKTSNTTH